MSEDWKWDPDAAPDDSYVPTPQKLQERLDSERIEFPVKANLTPRQAAFLRRFGTYIDTAEVDGVDDNLLSPEDAAWLRNNAGLQVLDDEIAADEPADIKDEDEQ